jgi:WD40 repeat protein
MTPIRGCRVLQFLLASFALAFAPVPAPPPTDRHGDALPPGVVARFGTVRLRASGGGMHLTADGKLLVAVSNSAARVFDRATGKLLRVLEPGPGYITAAALRPDGKTLYTLQGKRIVASDLETGKRAVFAEGEIYTANHAQLAVSADGKVLAAANPSSLAEQRPGGVRPGCVRLFDTATGKCLLDAEHRIDGQALALSPDGSMFAVGLYEELLVFDAKANREAFRLKARSYLYTRGAFSPDGKTVALYATHAEYGRIEIRDARTGKVLVAPEDKIPYAPRLRFSPDGSELWCFPGDRPPLALDPTGKKPARPLAAIKPEWRYHVMSADGKWLATGHDSAIRVWDMAANREATAAPDADAWLQAAPSPDGSRVATLGREALAVWDAKTGKQLMRTTGKFLGGELRWTEDGKQLTAGERGSAVWWDAATGKRVRTLKVADEYISQLSVRGNKVFASTWYDEAPPDEYAIDVATGKKLEWAGPEPLTAHWEDHVSPDGSRHVRWVDGANDRRGAKYAITDGAKQVNLSYWNEQSVFAFSPDGKRVIGAGKPGLRAWEAATGKPVGPDPAPAPDEPMFRGYARQVALSPDGALAAVTISEYVEHRQPGPYVDDIATGRVLLRIYDVKSGLLKTDLGHFDALDRVSFMPDGRHLLAVRHGYAEVMEVQTKK